MTTPGRAALLLVLTACGGQVGQAQRRTDSATSGGAVDGLAGGGASGGTQSEAGGAGPEVVVADGGADVGIASGGAATAAPEGGAAGDAASVASPIIDSGTRYCANETYCFGLSCYAPLGLEQHVCVNSCRGDADCGAREVCLEAVDLDPTCYRVCQTPFDCEYGFDCFDFANARHMLVCFPTPWATAWGAKHP